MPRSDTEAERKACVFVEENESFVEDGGPSTLERIVVDGSEILIALGKELQEATEALTRNQWTLVRAIEEKAPVKTLHALEVEERRLKRALAAKKEIHERFDAFWNRANEAYWIQTEKAKDGPYIGTVPSGAPKKTRGFFSRVFG